MAQNQYTCEAFSATFNTEAELERHNRTIHSQYKCELAGQPSTRQASWRLTSTTCIRSSGEIQEISR